MTIDRAIQILDPEHREQYDSLETVKEACRMGMEALKKLKGCQDAMAEKWNYVKKDGNPVKPGVYDVIVIFHGWDNAECKNTDELFAERTSRYFGEDDGSAWVMDNQPDEGMVWYEETGSCPGEFVYAWLPERGCENVELPEGVKWDGVDIPGRGGLSDEGR